MLLLQDEPSLTPPYEKKHWNLSLRARNYFGSYTWWPHTKYCCIWDWSSCQEAPQTLRSDLSQKSKRTRHLLTTSLLLWGSRSRRSWMLVAPTTWVSRDEGKLSEQTFLFVKHFRGILSFTFSEVSLKSLHLLDPVLAKKSSMILTPML